MSPESPAELTRRPRRRRLSAAALVLVLAHAGAADGEGDAVPELFADRATLAFELVLDRRALCRPRPSRPCASTPASLTYRTAAGPAHRLDVLVRARGGWRDAHCDVPPLLIEIAAPPESGPFSGQTLLPLTTHCRTASSRYEQYVLKEYLAYRLYELFTHKSLRVRLARITYRDVGKRGRAVERFGFVVEHFDHLAGRHGTTLQNAGTLRLSDADAFELATLELFQYLLGNTDWSIVAGHNVVRMRDGQGVVSAVPYDFDFAGLVGAPYASPPPNLPLRSVRERLFRGFCHSRLDWERLFTRFVEQRAGVLALIDDVPGLERAQRDDVRDYVLDFFDVIASPEKRRREIVGACRPIAETSSAQPRPAEAARGRSERRFAVNAAACVRHDVEAYMGHAPSTTPPPARIRRRVALEALAAAPAAILVPHPTTVRS